MRIDKIISKGKHLPHSVMYLLTSFYLRYCHVCHLQVHSLFDLRLKAITINIQILTLLKFINPIQHFCWKKLHIKYAAVLNVIFFKSYSKRKTKIGISYWQIPKCQSNRSVAQQIPSREVKLQNLVCFMVTRCRARIEISEPIWINGQIIIYLLQKCLNRQSVGRKMEDDDLTDHNLVDYICLPGNQGCRFGPGTREFPGYYEVDPRLLS